MTSGLLLPSRAAPKVSTAMASLATDFWKSLKSAPKARWITPSD
jgi:hypothetical protein